MGITSKEEFDFNDFLKGLNFEDVIDGLNKYFTEDETRVRVPRSIVEIRSRNKILFYRFDAEMYLDKLIAWLRTEHGIFYYPGMEAKYAKTERIPPLTERLMDEGALNSLKKLHKRVTGEEPEVDSHTLIADGILHGISNAISVKDAQIVELQTQMSKQGEELRILKSKYNDIMDYIRKETSRNGFNLPEENDGEPITVKMVFRDLLELMRKRDVEIKAKESGIEDLKEHITLLEADLKKAKIEKEKFLIEVADREEEIEELQKKGANSYLEHRHYIVNSIMNNIRQEASRNGYTLPEKVDGEPLIIERTFHNLLELMRIQCEELRILKSKCNRLNEIVEELNALNNEIKE